MKKMMKILSVLMLAMIIFTLITPSFVFADGPAANSNSASTGMAMKAINDITVKEPEGDLTNGIAAVIGKLLGFLQVASGLVAVVIIAITGFKFLMETPDVKKDLLPKAAPIIAGLVLVFGAASIAKLLITVGGA